MRLGRKLPPAMAMAMAPRAEWARKGPVRQGSSVCLLLIPAFAPYRRASCCFFSLSPVFFLLFAIEISGHQHTLQD
jgi:hypothetical protein